MGDTYSQMYVQIVFAVKGRHNLIREEIREELQRYISGIISAKKQRLFAIYCMPDHVHLLVSMKPNLAVSDLVRDIKANSSGFLKAERLVGPSFSWQEGFGVITYHESMVDILVNYILNQPVHHKKKTFREEYLAFLNEFKIKFDEKYLFDFNDE